MNNLKIKLSYELMGLKFKTEQTDKIENLDTINSIISSYYERLLYIEDKINIYNYDLQFKVNSNEWEYYNCYDYCKYLKDEYFSNNDNITEYSLLNKLDDIGYTKFMFYVRGLRDNETN